MDKQYNLINADSLQYFKEIPDNSVDFILTDPPYNLSQYSTGNMKFDWRTDINNDLAEWDKDFSPLDFKDDFLRVLKPTGNIFAFCSYNLIGKWRYLIHYLIHFSFLSGTRQTQSQSLERLDFLIVVN